MMNRRSAGVAFCVAMLGCGSSGPTTAGEVGSAASTTSFASSAARTSSGQASSTLSSSPDASATSSSATSSSSSSSSSLDGGGSSVLAVDARADGPGGGYGPYGAQGPATVTTVSASVTPGDGSTFSVTVYVPGTSGTHPVVILNSGFFQSALGYAPYGERLASWGIVAILRDDPGLDEGTSDIANDDAYIVTTWLAAQNALSGGPFEGKLDATNVGLAGHSRGGQAMLLSAEGGSKGKIKGVFGLDPVDGSAGSPLAVTNIGSIGVPLAFIGETTDSEGESACAPAADNYQVLYAAASSPAVELTAIDASHPDFEDPNHCFACSLCTAGTANPATVLAYSERYLMAFFARELLGDTSVGPAFQGAGVGLDVAAGLITGSSK